jgi:hypothetical protein
VESNVSTVETWDTKAMAVQRRRRGLIMTKRKISQSSKDNTTTVERQATRSRIAWQSRRDKQMQQKKPTPMKMRKVA